jgi:hypothetical protein
MDTRRKSSVVRLRQIQSEQKPEPTTDRLPVSYREFEDGEIIERIKKLKDMADVELTKIRSMDKEFKKRVQNHIDENTKELVKKVMRNSSLKRHSSQDLKPASLTLKELIEYKNRLDTHVSEKEIGQRKRELMNGFSKRKASQPVLPVEDGTDHFVEKIDYSMLLPKIKQVEEERHHQISEHISKQTTPKHQEDEPIDDETNFFLTEVVSNPKTKDKQPKSRDEEADNTSKSIKDGDLTFGNPLPAKIISTDRTFETKPSSFMKLQHCISKGNLGTESQLTSVANSPRKPLEAKVGSKTGSLHSSMQQFSNEEGLPFNRKTSVNIVYTIDRDTYLKNNKETVRQQTSRRKNDLEEIMAHNLQTRVDDVKDILEEYKTIKTRNDKYTESIGKKVNLRQMPFDDDNADQAIY